MKFQLDLHCVSFFIYWTWLLHGVLNTAVSPVALLPVCSDTNAGVTWIANSDDVYILSVIFNCSYMERQVGNDPCFQGDSIPPLDRINEKSRTHIIASNFMPGTVCTFSASSETILTRKLETVTANCTIRETSICERDPELCMLPANCTISPNDDQCQCSCSQGYTGRTDGMAGVICEREAIDEIQTGLGFPTSTVASESSFNTLLITSINVTPTATLSLSYGEWSRSSVWDAGTPQRPVNISSMSSPIPTTSDDQHTTPEIVFPALLLAFLLSVSVIIVLSSFGIAVARRNKMKRFHEKMAIPFSQLKIEKIDPDFNPVKIDKAVFIAESMQSIFHPFYEPLASIKEDVDPRNLDSISNLTETNPVLITEWNESNELESDDTVFEEELTKPASTSESTRSKTSDCIELPLSQSHQRHQSVHNFLLSAEDSENTDKLEHDKKAEPLELKRKESVIQLQVPPGYITHDMLPYDLSAIDADVQSEQNTDSSYIGRNELTVCEDLELAGEDSIEELYDPPPSQAADYTLPFFTLPKIYFDFPRDKRAI